MAERFARQLGLSKADLPNSIIEVVATLNKSGFEAYIVGGGVRDTLLGLHPKDFDAVTDAKPHEVKEVFGKRCRIIGRRFQLAHVYSGKDMIEVATFRAPPKDDVHTTTEGMITRDNVWGDIKQDFARRDFSVNALYYQPLKAVVHDFCHALDDIKNKTLRLLGHAPLRIEEDPVRLLRALRFKAKLGFEFDKELSEQFHDNNWALLEQVSPHRLYDESQKMFTGGYLVPLLPLLFEYGAIKHLIIYPPQTATALVTQVAINTDKRIAQGKSINPAFFYAALLWENYLYQLNKFKKKNMPFVEAQQQAASKVIERQRIKTAIPKFAEQFIRDIWLMQPKLANPRVRHISQLAEHPRFRAAFDFLLLREQCDDAANPLSESTNDMGAWWQHYQTLSEKQKQQAIDAFAGDARRGQGRGQEKGRRNRNRQGTVEPEPTHQSTAHKDAHKNSDESKSPVKSSKKRSPQQAHYARERAQLQKLSLGELAGSDFDDDTQPQPLFVIKAAKNAAAQDKDSDNKANKATVDKNTDKGETDRHIDNIDNKGAYHATPVSDKPLNERHNLNERHSKEQTQLTFDAAAYITAADDIPNKRRRRQPSTEAQDHKRVHHAQSSGRANSDSGASSDSSGDSGDKSSGVSKEARQDATQQRHQEIIEATQKVPATRRRRQPSSTLTVAERQAVGKSA